MQMPVQNVSQISLPGQFFSRFSTSFVNWHHFANNCTNGQSSEEPVPRRTKRDSTPKAKAHGHGLSPAVIRTQPLARPVCKQSFAFSDRNRSAFYLNLTRMLRPIFSESVRQKTRPGPERFQGHFTNPAMKPPRCIESFHKNAGQNYSSMRHGRSSQDSSSIRGFIEF